MSSIPSKNDAPYGNPEITVKRFGTTRSGTPVDEYTLRSGNGISASIITWGGIVRSLLVPDRAGRAVDVVLGFDSLEPYEDRHPYFGTITGRFANRIAHGRFTLDGKEYSLATNNGPNHLHGGLNGFDRAVWRARSEQTPDEAKLILSHVSPDGDEGYPGEVVTEVYYTLSSDNSLKIDYAASTSKPTPINLTNHSYFNLAGHGSGDVLHQELEINAHQIVPVDETQIPLGTLEEVKGTPFDFTGFHPIGARIDKVGGGYDHTFVIKKDQKGLKLAARAVDPASGRQLEVLTTEPGIQLYTGNFLDGSLIGKDGARYIRHAGFCLETQHFPDAVNQPSFPSTILRPGATYMQTTIFRFSAR